MNPILDGTTLDWTRSPSYWSKDYLFPCPCDVVFQAKVATVPTSDYLEIEYEDVTVGSWSDIWVGHTVIISPTSDHTDYLYIGRVADTPTSSLIPINESSYPLDTDFFVTIVDDFRELPRVRSGNLVDGRKSYQNVPPAIKNLRSAYVLWSTSSTATLTLSPVAVAMAHGATIDPDEAYHWDFRGSVTYTTGDEDTREIEIELEHGHLWGRLTATDSNGVSHWMVFEIFVDNPSAPTLVLVSADRLSITRNLTGHHCTFTAYKNVRTTDLIDGQRMTVARRPRYSNGDPNLDPVAFVGYLAKETNDTRGPNDKSVTFDLAGLWERAGQLSFNAIGIRHKTSPGAWDEMAFPTPQRAVWHMLIRYSVVPNLAGFDFDVTDNTWFGGDRNVSSNSLGDAVTRAMDEINAVMLGNPSGEMKFRRWAFFLTTAAKNALDSVATLTSSDLRDLNFARMHDDPVGRVVLGYAGFYTDGSDEKLGRAKAPRVTLGVSPEVREFNNQLLMADQSEEDLLAEAAERAANHLGVANIPYTLTATARDGFAWWTPSVHQWVPVTLATQVTTRGRTMSAVRHLLVGVQIAYDNRANTHTNQFELLPEPGPQSAMVWANLTPAAQTLTEIIRPLQSAYPGLSQPSSLNSPDTTTRRRFNRQNMGGMGLPYPADQSAEDAARTPDNGSRTFSIGFWVPTPVDAGFLSQLGETYTFTVKGKAVVGGAPPTIVLSWHNPLLPNRVDYLGKVGSDDLYRIFSYPNGINGNIDIESDTSCYYVNNLTVESGGTGWNWTNPPTCPSGVLSGTNPTDAIGVQLSNLIGAFTTGATVFTIQVGAASGAPGVTPSVTYGDTLFLWEEDEDGNPINVRLNPDGGLKIDGTTPSGLLFNDSHEYTFTLPGTGSEFSCVFNDSFYPDNQRVPMTINIQGVGAGT